MFIFKQSGEDDSRFLLTLPIMMEIPPPYIDPHSMFGNLPGVRNDIDRIERGSSYFENIKKLGWKMKIRKIISNDWFLSVFALIIIAAVIYLPGIQKAGIYRDDWYYLMDADTTSHNIFYPMFEIDRPVRAFLFDGLFRAFGMNIFPYHLLSFIWRLGSGLAALWLFHLLWPERRKFGWVAALLFTAYPGYLWWVEAVEYQPMILSLFLQVLSMALMIKSLRENNTVLRLIWTMLSIFTGLGYLLMVEYAIGMEVFRMMIIGILIARDGETPRKKTFWKKFFQQWCVFAAIPVLFLGWRFGIFQNRRAETDMGAQINTLLSNPGMGILRWVKNLFESVLNVGILAWTVPFFEKFFSLRLKDMLYALLWCCVVVVDVIWIFTRKWFSCSELESREKKEILFLGGIGLVTGVLPVIFGNRFITFAAFSHYSLPASLSAVLLISYFLFQLNTSFLRNVSICFVLVLAVLSQRAVLMDAIEETSIIQSFWWQVSWRVPDLKTKTVLMVNYSNLELGEDTDNIWGPANFMYDRRKTQGPMIEYSLSAIPMYIYSYQRLATGEEKSPLGEQIYRTHSFFASKDNVLVLSQPGALSCVHVISEDYPRFSVNDPAIIHLVAPYSNSRQIIAENNDAQPDTEILGVEPVHSWCYYYQKADLAAQKKDWQEVSRLLMEVEENAYHPNDRVEWMPFLQAQLWQGDEEGVKSTASKINEDALIRFQACQTVKQMTKENQIPLVTMQVLAEKLFCLGQ